MFIIGVGKKEDVIKFVLKKLLTNPLVVIVAVVVYRKSSCQCNM